MNGWHFLIFVSTYTGAVCLILALLTYDREER